MKIKFIEKRCLSTKELSKYLGVSESLIRRDYAQWCIEYKIRVYRIGRDSTKKKILFEKKDIDEKLLPALLIRQYKKDTLI